MFSGDYSGQRHSPLTQITPDNAHRLAAQWTFQTGDHPAARLRGDAAGRRRRHLPDRTVQQRLGARRAHRAAVLALPARAAERPHLRRDFAGQPRLRDAGRPPVHGDARRAPGGARRQDRRRALGHGDGRLQDRLRGDRRAARRQGQGDRRHLGRRFPDARLPRRLRSGHGRTPVALLHGARPGRARQRDVAGRRVDGARRRGHVGDGQLRPRAQPALLGHRQPQPALLRRRSQGHQSLHRVDRRHRRRHRQAESGITSSRRTTSTTGIRTTCRCWPRCRSAASRARS